MAKKPKSPHPTTVDFESQMIQGRPVYPPVPVGVSIKPWKQPARYYAWGHLAGNNCRYQDAAQALAEAVKCPDGVLFQNAKFDLELLEEYFPKLPALTWSQVHDTMFLLFLDDPHQAELGLKPSAERLLKWKPEEKDVVGEWLVKRQPALVGDIKMSASQNGKHYFMKYLEHCPGHVVGPYADGDTNRTEALFELLWAKTQQRGMGQAYDRERRLLPVLRLMERTGVRVDLTRLRADVQKYQQVAGELDQWLLKKLGRLINLDSAAELVEALVAAKFIKDIGLLGITEKGNLKSDKAALEAAIEDKQLAGVLRYRSQLKTCLSTFMEPWLRTAELSGGLIFTTWNQTRGGDKGGTRTGRLSSTPNFQNLPKEFDPIFAHEVMDPKEAKKLPKAPFDLPSLPLCRGYVIPFEKDHVLIGRDFQSQEPRLLGHFEDGPLLEAYKADPWLDWHDTNRAKIQERFQKDYPRKTIKNIGLGLIYGQGIGSLAMKNGQTVEDAKAVRNAVLSLYPGLKVLMDSMKTRSKLHQPFKTWGGREVYCEPPKVINGRLMDFSYRMTNYLIQGSAADATKEALIIFNDNRESCFIPLLQVHDELVISVPKAKLVEGMECLRLAMEGLEVDVPLLSEGEWSPANWGSMQTYDKKGKLVHA